MNPIRLVAAFGLLLIAANAPADDETPHWVEHNFARQHAALMHKVRTLKIPKIDWNDVTARQALSELSDKCKEADPEHKGISFVGEPSFADAPPFRLTVHAKNKSLLDVLKSMKYPFSVGRDSISLYYESGEGLCQAHFYVPIGYFKPPPEYAEKTDTTAYDVAPQLAARGVHFPSGSSAIYSPGREELFVKGGSDVVEAVDEALNP